MPPKVTRASLRSSSFIAWGSSPRRTAAHISAALSRAARAGMGPPSPMVKRRTFSSPLIRYLKIQLRAPLDRTRSPKPDTSSSQNVRSPSAGALRLLMLSAVIFMAGFSGLPFERRLGYRLGYQDYGP